MIDDPYVQAQKREALMIRRFPMLGKPSRFHPSGASGKVFFASSMHYMSDTGIVLYGAPGELGLRHGKWTFRIYEYRQLTKGIDLEELMRGGQFTRDINITLKQGRLHGPEIDRVVLLTDYHFDPMVFEVNLLRLRSFMANVNENPIRDSVS